MKKPLLISETPQPQLTCDALESASIRRLATHVRTIIFNNNFDILVINNEIATTKRDTLDLRRSPGQRDFFAGLRLCTLTQ